MLGYLELLASTLMYALGAVAQSTAARRVGDQSSSNVRFLHRLVSDKLYLLGFAGQVGGFVFAYLARATLPLYLVQAGASAAVGVAAVFGTLALGWRIRPAELAVLLVMALGLGLLAGASTVSSAPDIPAGLSLALATALAGCAVATVRCARLRTPLPLAVLAGIAFAIVAIVSRPLADEPLLELPLHPFTWLVVLAAVLGQVSLAFALRLGSVTSMVASMDATTMVLASVAGVIVLGDPIADGRQSWVVAGLCLVVLGVLALGSLRELPARETLDRSPT